MKGVSERRGEPVGAPPSRVSPKDLFFFTKIILKLEYTYIRETLIIKLLICLFEVSVWDFCNRIYRWSKPGNYPVPRLKRTGYTPVHEQRREI